MSTPSRSTTDESQVLPTAAPGATRIERIDTHSDARGLVFEPLDEAQLKEQHNVHVVLTQPGETRGNHHHLSAVEITSVVGPCLIRLKEGGVLRDLEVPAGETWRLVIPPGVTHAFRNTGSAPMVLVSFSSEVHDPSGASLRRESIL
jgi:UDP-2-acetamido-2,6-beta-L-arabino-hexul-4-ose reductase